jgi:hypothetical protein
VAVRLTEQQALGKLRRLAGADQDPALEDDELLDILTATQRYQVYTANTEYAVDDAVILSGSAYNGRCYICRVGGTSAATNPPTWPNGLCAVMAQRIADNNEGGTVVWEDDGPAWPEIYDLDAAAHNAWMRKATIASERIPIQDRDVKINQDAVYGHCLEMAARFAPYFVV